MENSVPTYPIRLLFYCSSSPCPSTIVIPCQTHLATYQCFVIRLFQPEHNKSMPNTSSGASSSSASNRVHQVVDEIHESEVKIVKKLGEGTTSIVYLGRYNGEEVAIKQLRQADEIEDVSSRQFLQSDFENELVINMQILHKYVVKLVGYILNRKQKRLKSLVFECCHGKVLNCNDYYSLKDSLCIGVQIANALAYVHSLGIIHRDLKPSQVIITRDKGNQIVSKLGDWGLSTTTNFQNVEFTSIVGTLEFVSCWYSIAVMMLFTCRFSSHCFLTPYFMLPRWLQKSYGNGIITAQLILSRLVYFCTV